ncbi:MAG: magnesium transporter [Nevskiaceae bacterium]|nr:MAG: magnesium transporter [Nevskiaceae bacterium]
MSESQERLHHRHLEQAREQIIDLLTRQAVERELVSRSEGNSRQDVVAQLVARQQQAQLEQKLALLHPADVAFILESLPPDAREAAWGLVRPERRGAVLLEINEAVLRALLGDMRPEEIAAVVRHLDSDDIAELLTELPEELSQEVLARLDRDDQAEVRSVLSFPDNSVGSMMDLDFLSVREDASLEAVLRLLRRQKSLPPEINQLIVMDRAGHLRGVLSLEQLLLSEPEREVKDVMTAEPTYFYTGDAIADAVTAFEKYDLISAPVVNLHKQVVGRITVDAVVDAIKERAQSESLRQVGLSEEEDLFAPAMESAKNRWPWLALNLLTAFVASRVIGAFEGIIVQLVALAALMPMVASIGGNTGNQTVALVIRGLALNQLGPTQLRKMFSKEFTIATVNGSLWGSVLGVATLALYQQWPLALVIAAAVLLNLWVAAAAGVLIPLTLQRFGRDPVMGSSVLLTACTDSMGFFIFLALAAVFLV